MSWIKMRGVLIILTAFLAVTGQGAKQSVESLAAANSQRYKDEYKKLLDTVEDKSGLEAIRNLHQQLDDDNDGTIEPSETTDFIKADLQIGDGDRKKQFHKKDNEITVADLWLTWSKSEVHNWTVEQTVEWLVTNVDLPQYKEVFIKEGVTGNQLPKAAADPNYLQQRLGIASSLHRSKISLKAMDVVLFGPPKDGNNWVKDVVLTSLLLALCTALFWAYKTKKHSEEHLSKMMKDMESLAKAERALQDMQNKLTTQEKVIKDVKTTNEEGGEEVGRLREEVEILRGELQRAEVELEDKCWMAPSMLQHWLQLTYELESQVFNNRKKSAELQMEQAKDACDKLKKKRSSLVGAFVSTHGRSIDDVDKSILEAKTALMELTQDLSERSQRWRQIEMLTGVNIVNNPGVQTLQRIVRYVGGGNRGMRSTDRLSSRMSSVSVDDLRDDLETRSIAASHVSHSSHLSSSRLNTSYNTKRTMLGNISRESSKESSEESDETGARSSGHRSHGHRNRLVKQHSRQSEMSASSGISAMSGVSSVSDYNQDKRSLQRIESNNEPEPDITDSNIDNIETSNNGDTVSISVSISNSNPNISENGASASPQGLHLSASDSALNMQTLKVSNNFVTQLSEVEESCSDTGSINDLEKKKKKRSFFNFRKKKEKAVS